MQILNINPSTTLPSLRSGLSKDTEMKSKCRIDGERSRTIKNQNYRLKIKSFTFGIVILIFAFCILNLIGCATYPVAKPPGIPGIYHSVKRGQTLWRISKIYDVELDELISINRISDASRIDVGQLIFIPHRQKPQSVSSRYPEDFIWPIKGKVTATYGQTVNNIINKGINIRPDHNSAEVVAARNGKVVFYAANFGGFGNTIIIDHGDGFSTVYARNSRVYVKVGDNVEKGAAIAKVGSAGRDKNIYLHFEIRKKYISQNPYFYLPR